LKLRSQLPLKVLEIFFIHIFQYPLLSGPTNEKRIKRSYK
jgi:hypothetical protein